MAAARAQSFTIAAEHLGITKSAVGKSIARLEERLGTKLFHRTTRRLGLTLGICQMPASLVRQHIEHETLVALLEDCSVGEIDVHATTWKRS